VTRPFIIRRLLAIFMIAGLVLAPVSQPSMAGTMPDVSRSGMPAEATTDEMAADMPATGMSANDMSNDMPCCPKAPAPIGCDKCLLMAACAAKCFSGLTATVSQPLFAVAAEHAYPRNDFWLDGLGQSPPEYPPRTLV
jgi:hypothetical protein